jgi:CDP-glycerol glycerophosphotransferase (TagB/SpsB family)
MGAGYSNTDWHIIDLLYSLEASLGLKIFVRFPPNDFAETDELKIRPHLHYALPGFRFSSKRGPDWDMSLSDISSLRDTLRYSEMVICYASSISVDAALFDKPIINLNFEIGPRSPMVKSPTRFYGMYHYKKALKTGAFKLVESPEELSVAIQAYKKNPNLEKRERQTVVAEQCEFTDGKSGERIALEIARMTEHKSRPN